MAGGVIAGVPITRAAAPARGGLDPAIVVHKVGSRESRELSFGGEVSGLTRGDEKCYNVIEPVGTGWYM